MSDTLYYLHVDVNTRGCRAFQLAVEAFLEANGFGQIIAAPNFIKPACFAEVTEADARGNAPDYVHLWSVPTLASLDLASTMDLSRDLPSYNAINTLVERERQEFIYFDRDVKSHDRIARFATMANMSRDRAKAKIEEMFANRTIRSQAVPVGHTIVRAVHHLTDIQYDWYSVYSLFLQLALEQAHWACVGIFFNVTGPLNTVVELWDVAPNATVRASASVDAILAAALQGNPPADLLREYRSYQSSVLVLQTYTA